MDCSLPGSSVLGISHARILEWVAISSSGGSSQPREGTPVSSLAGRYISTDATGKPEEEETRHKWPHTMTLFL